MRHFVKLALALAVVSVVFLLVIGRIIALKQAPTPQGQLSLVQPAFAAQGDQALPVDADKARISACINRCDVFMHNSLTYYSKAYGLKRGVSPRVNKLSSSILEYLTAYVNQVPTATRSDNGKAYEILRELAEKKRSQRMLSAAVSAGVGIALGITVSALASATTSSDEAAMLGFIPAGIGIGVALWQMAFPSEPEQEFLKISALPPDQREKRSAIALEQLARNAYQGRMISAAVNAALAVASLVFPYSNDSMHDRVVGFILNMSFAAYSFFFPTDEEKAYQTYIRANAEEEQPAKTTGSPPVISSVIATPTPNSLTWSFETTATDPDNDIVSYTWYFGDDAILQGGSVVKHTYSTAGTYQVCVKVWDKRNLTDKACKTITVQRAAQPPVVSNQPPRAEFRWSPLLPEEGQPVQFISDSTDPEGAIASLEWNFGDGGLGSGQTVTHIFTTPGNYRVCLTAKDTGGLSNQICKEIKIAQQWIPPSNEKTRYFTSVISRDNNRQPTWSPDGKFIMFTSDRDMDWELYAINLDTQAVSRVTKSPGPDFDPSWCRDGKVVFVSDRDGQTGVDLYILDMTTRGVTRLTHDPAFLNVAPSCTPDGRAVIFTTNRDGDFEIYSIATETRAINRITFSPVQDWNPQVSPDGRYIAFQSQVQGNSEIFVMDITGRNLRRLTFNPGEDVDPAWSPDGKKIAFASNRDGNFKIYVIDATGENEVVLTPDTNNNLHPVWSPDSRRIAFESDRTRNWEIWVIDVDGKNLKRLTGVSK